MLLQIAGLIVLGWLAMAIIVTFALVRIMRGGPKLDTEPPVERIIGGPKLESEPPVERVSRSA